MTPRHRFALASLSMTCLVACSQKDIAGPSRIAAGGRALAQGGVAPTGADLQISGSIPFGSPNIGSSFAYSFQVKNAGPDSAPGATLVDVLPTGMSFGSASVNDAVIPCSQTDQTVTCPLGTIKNGAQVTVLFLAVSPSVAGTDTNSATATSLVSDPKPTNNTVNILTKVLAPNARVAPPPVFATAFTTMPVGVIGGQYVIAGGPNGVGFQFTPTVTGTWAGLVVSTFAGSGGRSEFWIYADDPLHPGHPGALVGGPVFGVISSTATSTLDGITVPSTAAGVLTAGKQYWIFGFGNTAELSGFWNLNANPLLTGRCAVGPFGFAVLAAPCVYPAFQVIVAQ
jgi:uncharacterized repeat protein (TIGR01451 family)